MEDAKDDLDQTERNRRAILHLSRACLKLAVVVGVAAMAVALPRMLVLK